MKFSKIPLLLFTLYIYSCGSKPKVIVEDASSTNTTVGLNANATAPQTAETGTTANDMHQVTAIEILQAERYTYLKVIEKADTFWIASTKMEPKVGNTYFYRGGLLKTNFESQEYKRTFDKIYLVSSIMDASVHPGGAGELTPVATSNTVNASVVKKIEGGIKLADLLKYKEANNGKIIIVSGKVVKANYGIMGKNWYHLQDGTKAAGKNADLTITTIDNIPLDAIVNFEGKIFLNKDFGAGYKYDIIMEEAKMK